MRGSFVPDVKKDCSASSKGVLCQHTKGEWGNMLSRKKFTFCIGQAPSQFSSQWSDSIYHIIRARKKLCKLYTNPTFNPSSLWFPVRYEMYSLRRKPYTNHTLNYTLRRFKPYTKTIHESLHRHTNPTQKIYTKPYTATLHRNGTQFYLGAHPGKTRSAPRKN